MVKFFSVETVRRGLQNGSDMLMFGRNDLGNAAEEMRKLTNSAYQKIDGSRRIGSLLKVDGTNASTSFNVLCDGIKRLVE